MFIKIKIKVLLFLFFFSNFKEINQILKHKKTSDMLQLLNLLLLLLLLNVFYCLKTLVREHHHQTINAR